MNLSQLEYICTLEEHRHFGKAAAACFVTQPTLSMMVQRLEEELNIKIFDRSKKPLEPTPTGRKLIQQAQKILMEAQRMEDIVAESQKTIQGKIHLAIIPTLAPYLLPMFIKSFLSKYPLVQLKITEYPTRQLIEKLEKGGVDVGVLVTPLNNEKLKETPLFYENFYVYSSHDYAKEYLLPEDINPNELWLLEEGHCFRSQILNLCELHKNALSRLEYAAGSLETLRQLVDSQEGVTILPELAVQYLSDNKKQRLKEFQPPAPVREVSLVTRRDHTRQKLVQVLQEEILNAIPKEMRGKEGRNVVAIR